MKEQSIRIKLPSLSEVKDALYDDWSLKVRRFDNWRCLLCDECEQRLLSPHHWYISDHYAKAARYAVENGATLCYTCHVRGIHFRADAVSVNRLTAALARRRWPSWNLRGIEANLDNLAQQELTTQYLRALWDNMRAHPVSIADLDVRVSAKGSKFFVRVRCPYPIAVVGNTMTVPNIGICEVRVVIPDEFDYRYTVAKTEG